MTPIKNKKPLFIFAAVVFVATALFHVVAMRQGGFTERHCFFVFSNMTFAILSIWRPLLFPVLLSLLVPQQLWSHGQDAIQSLASDSTGVDWMSFAICIYLPILLWFAWHERLKKAVI